MAVTIAISKPATPVVHSRRNPIPSVKEAEERINRATSRIQEMSQSEFDDIVAICAEVEEQFGRY